MRCNEKGSLSKADRQLLKVIQTYWRIARRCFNKIGYAQKFARRTDFGFPWFASVGRLCQVPRRIDQCLTQRPVPGLQQLIWVNVDRDGDVFGEWQFVESFADESAQAHDGFAADQNVETKLTL